MALKPLNVCDLEMAVFVAQMNGDLDLDQGHSSNCIRQQIYTMVYPWSRRHGCLLLLNMLNALEPLFLNRLGCVCYLLF